MSSTAETVVLAEWLAAQRPEPPAALVERMQAIVAGRSCASRDLSDALIDAAVSVFGNLSDERESAIDLLAADALITYAMQVAADSDVEQAAASAMKRIANAMRTQ